MRRGWSVPARAYLCGLVLALGACRGKPCVSRVPIESAARSPVATTLDGFSAEARGEWDEASRAYESAARNSLRPWVPLALGARGWAQEGDSEKALQLFDAAARAFEGRERGTVTTEVSPGTYLWTRDYRGGTFVWLSPTRIAVTNGETVSVVDIDTMRVEYVAYTGERSPRDVSRTVWWGH